jgi:3-oxoacyl-[acyl-carrier-protein] synthase II
MWNAVIEGRSCVVGLRADHLPEEHQHVLDSLPSQVVGKVDHLRAVEDLLTRSSLKSHPALESVVLSSAFVQFACLAADEALRDSGMNFTDNMNTSSAEDIKEDIGVCIGAGMSSTRDLAQAGILVKERRTRRLSPFFVPRILVNTAAGAVSSAYGFQGPNLAPSTACATGAHAIGDAFRIVQRGEATAMLAGGTESCVDALALAGFSRMKALSTNFNDVPSRASRPFDKDRDGFVLSEGASVLLLERLDHALERNAPNIYCEVLGHGMSGDAHHITKPNTVGATLSMTRALRSAGIPAGDVTYVNAHATSTPLGDRSEIEAIHRVFIEKGNSSKRIDQPLYVSSSKGTLGHMLGAAGATEAAVAALACQKRAIPPNTNLEDDIDCSIDNRISLPRTNGADRLHLDDDRPMTIVTNSLGFGGTNTSLVFRSF